jgi:SAM-dependent methyltransferase
MTEVFDAYAAYYDLLYRDKDYPQEARYVRSLLTREGVNHGNILELGCGTGKHAEQLVRLGYSVQGIDMSRSMVEIARRRAPAELATRLQFQLGDARSIRLATQFDAVISLFHVVSYQTTNDDLAAMLATVSAHLKAGGTFVFDFWYGPGVLTDPPTAREKHLGDDSIEVTRTAEPTVHANDNIVDVHYKVRVKQTRTGTIADIEETHRMRYLFLPELKLMLRAAGMEMIHAQSWMSERELGLESWLAVVTARRT